MFYWILVCLQLCWFAGFMVCRFAAKLLGWFVDSLVFWCAVLLVCWFVGFLVNHLPAVETDGLLVYLFTWLLVYWLTCLCESSCDFLCYVIIS